MWQLSNFQSVLVALCTLHFASGRVGGLDLFATHVGNVVGLYMGTMLGEQQIVSIAMVLDSGDKWAVVYKYEVASRS